MFASRQSRLSKKVYKEALRLIQRVTRGEVGVEAFWRAHGATKLRLFAPEINQQRIRAPKDSTCLDALRNEVQRLIVALDRLPPTSYDVSQPDCLRSLVLSGVIALEATGELRDIGEFWTTYVDVLKCFEQRPASEVAFVESAPSAERVGQGGPQRKAGESPEFVVSLDGQGHFSDIESAVRQAPEWATVRVRPGVYPAGFLLLKPLRVVADGPPDSVVIESSTASAVVSFASGGLVQGFTIKGNGGPGGGTILTSSRAVWVEKGSVVVEDCDISTNGAIGVFVTPGHASPVIRRCKIHGASLTGLHFEAQAGGQVGGLVEDCDIFNNGRSGIVILSGAAPRIVGNRVFDNGLVGIGAAEGGRGVIVDNDVWNHRLADIKVDEISSPVVSGNRFTPPFTSAQSTVGDASEQVVDPVPSPPIRADHHLQSPRRERNSTWDLDKELSSVVRHDRMELHPVLDAVAALRRVLSPQLMDDDFARFLSHPLGKRLVDLMSRLEAEFAGPSHSNAWPKHNRWLHAFDSLLAYALTNSPERFDYANAVYSELVETFDPHHRRQLAFDVYFSLEPTAEQVSGMLPFMFVDPDYSVVSTAALNFMYLCPPRGGDTLAGVREVVAFAREYNRTDDDEERVAAWLGATLVLGDRRALPILHGTWDLLRPKGQVVLAKAGALNGVPNAAQIEYYLLWLEAAADDPKAAIFPAIALATLAPRVAEAGVADFYRDLPAPHSFAAMPQEQEDARSSLPTWSRGRVLNESATRVLAHWDAFEYARIVAPRIAAAIRTLGDTEVSGLLDGWRSLAFRAEQLAEPPANVQPAESSLAPPQLTTPDTTGFDQMVERLRATGLPAPSASALARAAVERAEQMASDRRVQASASDDPLERDTLLQEAATLEERILPHRRDLHRSRGKHQSAAPDPVPSGSNEELRRHGIALIYEIEAAIERGRAIAGTFSDPIQRDEYLQELLQWEQDCRHSAEELTNGRNIRTVVSRLSDLYRRLQ